MIPTVMFYIFSGLLLVSAGLVVSVQNPVHAVCCLILAFINGAGLFLLAGAEFLAMILIIVYVGAVAVLFLFVVMMLGLNIPGTREKSRGYLWVAGFLGLVLGGELIIVVTQWSTQHDSSGRNPAQNLSNAHSLGDILYTTYALPFQISGLILLVAMMGAITLTFRVRKDVRRQKIHHQLERSGTDTVTLVNVPLGKGLQDGN